MPTSGFARVDHHRDLRLGMPEAVYGPGKTPEHCAAVVEELLGATDGPVLLTRADEAQVKAASRPRPALGAGPGVVAGHRLALDGRLPPGPRAPGRRRRRHRRDRRSARGHRMRRRCSAPSASAPRVLTDCGVAGLHRLLAEVDTLAAADAVVVIAGMEGALASVVGGLTPAPGRRRARPAPATAPRSRA